MPATATASVFLVDDHRVVRLGFRHLLDQSGMLAVVGEAGSGEEALEKIPQVRPDLAVVDISMGDMDGIELTRRLKQKRPDLQVLIVSMHDETYYVERALEAGASGYVLKDNVDELMVEAVEAVLDGRQYFCGGVQGAT